VNQVLIIHKRDAKSSQSFYTTTTSLFVENNKILKPQVFQHKENFFDDYFKQVLLPHKMSQFGPCIAVADVDGDGMEDFYIGGAKGQDGVLYKQLKSGFQLTNLKPWSEYTNQEDTGVHFFDADSDGDADLYIVSGGNSYSENHDAYQDRLFLNDGNGNFTSMPHLIPEIKSSGSVVTSGDFDQDGDLDLFVGGRHTPGKYPTSPRSYLLENRNGKFVDISDQVPGLGRAGMVTSALWVDLQNDQYPELIIAGEWMSIRVFNNQSGSLSEVTERLGLSESQGWWNSLATGDFDKDGDLDIVVGNLGLNYKYQASNENPFHLYSKDFDKNGSMDIVLAFENQKGQFPVRGRQCSSEQIPGIKIKFPSYNKFGASNLQDIYGDTIEEAEHFIVKSFASIILINNGSAGFSIQSLPPEAQFAPCNSIIVEDFTKDGNLDILLAGNLYVSEVETGRADAGTGLLLQGIGDGTFKTIPSVVSGFWANRDVKTLRVVRGANASRFILVGNNDDMMQVFEVK